MREERKKEGEEGEKILKQILVLYKYNLKKKFFISGKTLHKSKNQLDPVSLKQSRTREIIKNKTNVATLPIYVFKTLPERKKKKMVYVIVIKFLE